MQKPIPVWVGGESGPALRRTARLGDGWYPIGTNPEFRLDSLPRYKAGIEKLHGMIPRPAANHPTWRWPIAYRRTGKSCRRRPMTGSAACSPAATRTSSPICAR